MRPVPSRHRICSCSAIYPRRFEAQCGEPQLPYLRARRDDVQPYVCGVRASSRPFEAKIYDKACPEDCVYVEDDNVAPEGRIMDAYLSEHMCEGWLEGYILTGRHGFFASYESFIRIVDSMVSQHAKWLKVTNELPWRQDISSLNLILTSNVCSRTTTASHAPGSRLPLDHVTCKKADVIRCYLPPDTKLSPLLLRPLCQEQGLYQRHRGK